MDRPVLTTERLIVRGFRADDWMDLREYLCAPEVIRFEPEYPAGDDGAKGMAEFFAGSSEFWAVELKAASKLIGHVHFGLREPKEFENWNLGYVFNPAYYRQGYATEAARRVLRYGFEVVGARRVESGCNPENIGSWRVLEKCGLRREAHHILNGFMKRDAGGNPIWQDGFTYAVLREEWIRNHG